MGGGMIIIAGWKIFWLYLTLMVFYMGLGTLSEPVKRKKFNFDEAMIETIVGLGETMIGAILTLYVLNI